MSNPPGWRWPSLSDVARELRLLNANVEAFDAEWVDVRLQIYPRGGWAIRVGDASCDQDNPGFEGAFRILGVYRGKERRFDSTAVARDLLAKAKDDVQWLARDWR